MIKRVMLPFDEAKVLHQKNLVELHSNFEKESPDSPNEIHGIFRQYWERIRCLNINLNNDPRVEDGGIGLFKTYLVRACKVKVYVPKWCTVEVDVGGVKDMPLADELAEAQERDKWYP